MRKSSKTEWAQRINTAHDLIKTCDTTIQAVNAMIAQYHISRRQAYRYIQEAQRIGKQIPIPETTVAFTIKIAPSLIQSLRKYSKRSELTLGEIVTKALETFFHKGRQRGKRQENTKTDRS